MIADLALPTAWPDEKSWLPVWMQRNLRENDVTAIRAMYVVTEMKCHALDQKTGRPGRDSARKYRESMTLRQRAKLFGA